MAVPRSCMSNGCWWYLQNPSKCIVEAVAVLEVLLNPDINGHAAVDAFPLFVLFMIKITNAARGIHIVDAATSNPITASAPEG